MQTFKALITVHKILQEGHPVVSGGDLGRSQLRPLLILCARLLKKLMVKLAGWKPVRAQWGMMGSVVRTECA